MSRYFRNSFWVLVGTIVGSVLSLGLSIILARTYGPERFGQIQLVLAGGSVFAQIGTLGLSNGTTYFLSISGDDRIATSKYLMFALTLTGILLAPLILLTIHFQDVAGAVLFSGSDQSSTIMLVVTLFGSLLAIHQILSAALRGLEEFRFLQLWESVLRRVFHILPAFMLPVIGYIWALPATEVVVVLGFSVFAFARIRSMQATSSEQGRSFKMSALISYSLPLALAGIAALSKGELNTIFLGWLSTAEDAGFFKIAIGISSKMAILLGVANAAFFPQAAKMAEKGRKRELSRLYEQVNKMLWIVLVPVVLFVALNRQEIIRILYGVRYIAASNVLLLCLVGMATNIAIGPANNLVLAFEKTRAKLGVDVLALVLTVLLNLWAIPHYGSAGAGMAWSVGIIVWSVSMYLVVRYKLGIATPYRRFHLSYGMVASVVAFTAKWVSEGLLGLTGAKLLTGNLLAIAIGLAAVFAWIPSLSSEREFLIRTLREL